MQLAWHVRFPRGNGTISMQSFGNSEAKPGFTGVPAWFYWRRKGNRSRPLRGVWEPVDPVLGSGSNASGNIVLRGWKTCGVPAGLQRSLRWSGTR